jgi:asparagine synthetase B (glutamine-hydrolysing)
MCGIARVLNLKGFPLEEPTVAIRMASSLVHCGPDEEGSLVDGPVAFGFGRLRNPGCHKVNEGQKGPTELVISRSNASEVFERVEKSFHFLA